MAWLGPRTPLVLSGASDSEPESKDVCRFEERSPSFDSAPLALGALRTSGVEVRGGLRARITDPRDGDSGFMTLNVWREPRSESGQRLAVQFDYGPAATPTAITPGVVSEVIARARAHGWAPEQVRSGQLRLHAAALGLGR